MSTASGSTVEELVESVARVLSRAISVEDLDGHLIAYSTHQDTTDKVRTEFLLSKVVSDQVRSWQDSHGIAQATAPVQIPENTELGMRGRVCVPLLVRGFRVGYLWVQESEQDQDGSQILSLLPKERELIATIAEQLLGENTADSQYRRERENQFTVALGAIPGLHTTKAQQTAVDLIKTWLPLGELEHCALAVLIPAWDHSELTQHSGTERMLANSVAALQATVGDERVLFSAGLFSHATVLLRPQLSDQDLHQLHQNMIHELKRGPLAKALASTSSSRQASAKQASPGSLGVSTTLLGLEKLGTGYAQAVTAAQAGAVDPYIGPGVVRFEQAGIYPLLSTEKHTFTGPYQKLVEHDEDGGLSDVLEFMLERDGSVAELARTLHVHRSSVYNKIARIKSILGQDPLKGQTRLALHWGIKQARWQGRPEL